MMEFFDTESLGGFAPAVLAVLFDVTLKGALILALSGLLTILFRKASAAMRHLFWSLAVSSVLVLPLLMFTLPAWQLAALSEVPYLRQATSLFDGRAASQQGEATGAVSPDPVSAGARPGQAPSRSVEPAPSFSSDRTAGGLPASYEAMLASFSRLYAAARATHWTIWLTLAWLGGVMFVLLRFGVGAVGVWWLAHRARPVKDPVWSDLAEEMGDCLGLTRPVRLLRSLRAAMPMTWGLWRPKVLLPVSASDWSRARLRSVLMHEFAHIKRWDCLTQTLAQLACAIHWFNPLVWHATRRMRQEREKACDDYVIAAGVMPSEYARHLLDIARSTRSTLVSPLTAVSIARPSQLEGRILAILDARKRRTPGGRAAATGVLLTAALVLPLAAMRPADPSAETAAERTEERHAVERTEERHAVESVASARGEAPRWTGRAAKARGGGDNVNTTPAANRGSPARERIQPPAREPAQGPMPAQEPVPAQGSAYEPGPRPYGVEDGSRTPWMTVFERQSERDRLRQVRALARDEGEQTVETLGHILVRDPSGSVRSSAARALGDVGCNQALQALLFALEDVDVEVRQTAVWALGKIGDSAAVPALSDVLLCDRSCDVRRDAAWVLSELKDDRAVPALRRALHDADEGVRRQAALALDALDLGDLALSPGADAERLPVEPADRRLSLHIGGLDLAISADLLGVVTDVLAELHLRLDGSDLMALVNGVEGQGSFAQQMQELGFRDASDGELLVARFFGVDAGYVRSIRRAGYYPSLMELVQMRLAGIDGSFLEERTGPGYRRLPVEELIAMRTSETGWGDVREPELRAGRTSIVEEETVYRRDARIYGRPVGW